MAETTTISWCHHTTGFWSGCTKVSPGCDHCYAEARDRRFFAGAHWGAGAPRSFRLEAARKDLLHWNRKALADGVRRRVFINSLSDFFDNEVPQEARDVAWSTFRECEALDILLLTKRPQNIKRMQLYPWVLRNVWMGTTVTDQAEADRNIPALLDAPAAVRFLSIEPMLGPITIPGFGSDTSWCPICRAVVRDRLSEPHERSHPGVKMLGVFDPTQHCIDVPAMLNWVIVGGESGANARPMNPQWARSIRDQCAAAGAPFHFKQWGEWVSVSEVAGPGRHYEFPDGATVRRTGAKLAGHMLDGVEHRAVPFLQQDHSKGAP